MASLPELDDLTDEFIGLPCFFNYDNSKIHPSNTCGQAVIATIVDRLKKPVANLTRNVYSELDRDTHYPDTLVDLIAASHGPHWPWRNGVTNRSIIVRALRSYGISFREYPARLFQRKDSRIEELLQILRNKHVAIVLLDTHALKLSPPFYLHWAIVYAANKSIVKIATWGRTIELSWTDFLRAWKTWFVPPPYTYYMIEIQNGPRK